MTYWVKEDCDIMVQNNKMFLYSWGAVFTVAVYTFRLYENGGQGMCGLKPIAGDLFRVLIKYLT